MRGLKLLACCLACAAASAQRYAAGPQVVTFFSGVDDSDQPYALYVPKDYDASKKYPLVISLHGAGSNHRLNLRRVFGQNNLPGETDAEAARYFPRFPEVNYFVACPLARGSMGYQGIAERDVYDVVDDMKKRFSIDDDRVYLTGLSMGGGGALWLGLTRPGVWAAIAPVCGAAPEEARSLAANALNLPVHLFHGSIDPVVPVASSRAWQHDLLEQGCPVRYTEYPNVRHNSWDNAYRNAAVFDLFAQFRRNRFPPRVRFATQRYKYASAYWITLDGITPGSLAQIDAQFTGNNQMTIRTQGLDGFTLNLAGHPMYQVGSPLAIAIDGQRIKRGAAVSFIRTAQVWQPGRYVPPPANKHPGVEGPIAEAVASRHIYVYGTGGLPADEELQDRRRQAREAAEWSAPRSRLLLTFHAISDAATQKDVRASDLEHTNLILFGAKETNAWIARYAAQLPLALNPSAADYGLLYIYPAGGRYLLINSGLPWWTGADQAKRGGWPFVPAHYRTLQTFGDFILFKGSLENVVAEGLFTADWKLPAAAAQKMKNTGAVQIQ